MIRNKFQYHITAREADKFAKALESADADTAHLDPALRRATRGALASQLEELRAQLAEYEAAPGRKPVRSEVKGRETA